LSILKSYAKNMPSPGPSASSEVKYSLCERAKK